MLAIDAAVGLPVGSTGCCFSDILFRSIGGFCQTNVKTPRTESFHKIARDRRYYHALAPPTVINRRTSRDWPPERRRRVLGRSDETVAAPLSYGQANVLRFADIFLVLVAVIIWARPPPAVKSISRWILFGAPINRRKISK